MATTTTHRQPIDALDRAKGVAIMLVVFAHVTLGLQSASVLEAPVAAWSMPFFVWYMAVFFLTAGFVLSRSLETKPPRALAASRTYRLLYIYVVWGGIFAGLKVLAGSRTNSEALSLKDAIKSLLPWNPIEHMWFLPVLLWATLLSVVVLSYIPQRAQLIVFVILAALMMFFVSDAGTYRHYLQYPPFMFAGIALARSSAVTAAMYGPRRGVRLLAIASLGLYFVLALRYLAPGVSFHESMGLNLALSFLGAVSVIALVAQFKKGSFAASSTAILGKSSLYIYVTHVPILALIRITFADVPLVGNPWILLALSTAACLTLGVYARHVAASGPLERLFAPPPMPFAAIGSRARN